jgi:hypothetical protein
MKPSTFWWLCVGSALLLMLAACGSGPAPSSVPTPPPPAAAPAHPPTVLFQGDFIGPSINIGFACEGPAVGLDCSTLAPSFTWGASNQPQIQPCILPGPNKCYVADGTLHFDSTNSPGWMAILAKPFPKDQPVFVEGVVDVTMFTDRFFYTGVVNYDGELDYEALYIDGQGYTIYDGFGVQTINIGPATPGAHVLGLGYDGKGTWQFFVDGVLRYTLPGNVLRNDAHPAFWTGGAAGTLSRFTVYGSAP